MQIHVTTKSTVSADLRELVDYVMPAASYMVVNGKR